ncbi:hypothetical protein PSPO01_16208 [Paraphaeosphaeria sporulosa]
MRTPARSGHPGHVLTSIGTDFGMESGN